MIDLSIIIPSYNSGNGLTRMVECIFNQGIDFADSNDNFKGELIIIDDGSTDDSIIVLEDLLANSPPPQRVTIIRQENKGVSAARNAGLEIAKGDYIYFADADDFINPNALCQILKIAKFHNAEITRFPFRYVKGRSAQNTFDTKTLNPTKALYCETILNSNGYLDYNQGIAETMLWHLIIKRDNIKNLRFETRLKLEEDYLFELSLLSNPSLKIAIIKGDAPYAYVVHPGSACYSLTIDNALTYKYAALGYNLLLAQKDNISKIYRDSVKFRETVSAMIYLFALLKDCRISIKEAVKEYYSFRRSTIIPLIKEKNIPQRMRNRMNRLKRFLLNHSVTFYLLCLGGIGKRFIAQTKKA